MKFIVFGVIVVILVGLIFAPKKKNVGKKLEKARALFADDEIIKVNEMLDEIIIFPISEKYTGEYAAQLVESLKFLKQVSKAQNINNDKMIDPVIEELTKLIVEGGKLDSDITKDLEAWIDEMTKDASKQSKALVSGVVDGTLNTEVTEFEDDFTSEVKSEQELKVINSIGSYILRRKFKDGLAFIDSHLPKDMSAYKATLLDQRAALLFMDGNIKEAIDHYHEILLHYPENYRIKSALAEGYAELELKDESLKYAKEVVNFSRDKDLLKTCRKIVNRFE